MSLLLESIKIFNGKCYHLAAHEVRANRSRSVLYGEVAPLSLRKHIQVPLDLRQGLVKCRILYDEAIREISFARYEIRSIRHIKIVHQNDLVYDHKYVERAGLDSLFATRGHADEIMIIRNDMVTDGYYYNLVFEKNGQYFTPEKPLLLGTQRAKILASGLVTTANIHVKDIINYDKVHYINALTPLGKIVVDISNIV